MLKCLRSTIMIRCCVFVFPSLWCKFAHPPIRCLLTAGTICEIIDMDWGPIAVWSGSGLEAWKKNIKNLRSGPGCRAKQLSTKAKIRGIFLPMLITSAPLVANAWKNLLTKQFHYIEVQTTATKERDLIITIHYRWSKQNPFIGAWLVLAFDSIS